MTDVTISATVEADERASTTARLLSQLPAWFGMAEANDAYAMTRAFYRSVGFLPLEETPAFWPGNSCLLIVKPLGCRRARVSPERGEAIGVSGREAGSDHPELEGRGARCRH